MTDQPYGRRRLRRAARAVLLAIVLACFAAFFGMHVREAGGGVGRSALSGMPS